MQDKFPKRNVNVRIEEKDFLEFEAVALFLGRKRSDLVRHALEQFIQRGTLIAKGKAWNYPDLVAAALQMLDDKDIQLEDLIQKKHSDVVELDPVVSDEFERVTKKYVQDVTFLVNRGEQEVTICQVGEE